MDIVYVIYFDSKMYRTSSRKTAYLEEKYARQVITSDAKDIANQMMKEDGKDSWDISVKELEEYREKAKRRFEIREFSETPI